MGFQKPSRELFFSWPLRPKNPKISWFLNINHHLYALVVRGHYKIYKQDKLSNYPTIPILVHSICINWLNIPSLSFKCQFCRNHHLALSENRLIHSKLLIIPSSFIIIFPTKIALSMPLGFRGRKNSWFSLVDALPNKPVAKIQHSMVTLW